MRHVHGNLVGDMRMAAIRHFTTFKHAYTMHLLYQTTFKASHDHFKEVTQNTVHTCIHAYMHEPYPGHLHRGPSPFSSSQLGVWQRLGLHLQPSGYLMRACNVHHMSNDAHSRDAGHLWFVKMVVINAGHLWFVKMVVGIWVYARHRIVHMESYTHVPAFLMLCGAVSLFKCTKWRRETTRPQVMTVTVYTQWYATMHVLWELATEQEHCACP
jgi:hypothetical protein